MKVVKLNIFFSPSPTSSLLCTIPQTLCALCTVAADTRQTARKSLACLCLSSVAPRGNNVQINFWGSVRPSIAALAQCSIGNTALGYSYPLGDAGSGMEWAVV
jgi:hypothetical protein